MAVTGRHGYGASTGASRIGRLLSVLGLSTAAALGGGCSLFSTSVDPVLTYRLEGAVDELPPVTGETCCVLEISTPLPAPGFATARMIYQRNAFQNEAFAYAEWVDTLPSMVRVALIEAFDGLGRFDSVVAAPSPGRADYRLESRALSVIQRFDGTTSEVELSVWVRVVALEDRTLLGSRRFVVTQAAETANPVGGVAAANEALTRLLADLSAYVASVTAG